MTAIVFMDTETTGLNLDDIIWEFAAIRREADGSETEHHLFIRHDPSEREGMPDRFRADLERRYDAETAMEPDRAASYIADLFHDRPHVVGAVPNFDAERIALLLSEFDEIGPDGPPWHYHLIDVETLAVGWLRGRRHALVVEGTIPADSPAFPPPPWDSDDLSRAIGVDPDQYARHTAMGDIRWAMAIYDAVMGGAR